MINFSIVMIVFMILEELFKNSFVLGEKCLVEGL